MSNNNILSSSVKKELSSKLPTVGGLIRFRRHDPRANVGIRRKTLNLHQNFRSFQYDEEKIKQRWERFKGKRDFLFGMWRMVFERLREYN